MQGVATQLWLGSGVGAATRCGWHCSPQARGVVCGALVWAGHVGLRGQQQQLGQLGVWLAAVAAGGPVQAVHGGQWHELAQLWHFGHQGGLGPHKLCTQGLQAPRLRLVCHALLAKPRLHHGCPLWGRHVAPIVVGAGVLLEVELLGTCATWGSKGILSLLLGTRPTMP